MSSGKLSSQSYTFDPRPNLPLLVTAKRYWSDSSPLFSQSDDALTLIFAHGTGFHKEHWEPVIDDLLVLLATRNSGVTIRDIWSIDCPNHGEAAILNEKTLLHGYEPVFQWKEYSVSLHAFLSGLGTGVDVDFRARNLVAVGHSMGAVAFILSTTIQPLLKFHQIFLVEPMLVTLPDQAEITKQQSVQSFDNFLAIGATSRRDVWASRQEAATLLKARAAWKIWDPRVLAIYLKYGFRDLPTAMYPDSTVTGVTLTCSKRQEAACFRDANGIASAYRYLSAFLKRFPVHIIYGAVDDYVSAKIKDDVLNVASGGIEKFASVTRVPGAGHLATQTHPRGVAEEIHVLLQKGVKDSYQGQGARL